MSWLDVRFLLCPGSLSGSSLWWLRFSDSTSLLISHPLQKEGPTDEEFILGAKEPLRLPDT